jgi:hypothetical protein
MSAVVILGLFAGIGCVGVWCGLRTPSPLLESVAAAMSRSGATRPGPGAHDPRAIGAARTLVTWVGTTRLATYPRWTALKPSLAITGESLEGVASKSLVLGGAGLLGPPILWLVAQWSGIGVSIAAPVLMTLVAVPLGVCLPFATLLTRAHERRRHFRTIIGSFVDIVVLSLAGGVGVEGALYAASQVSTDWAARSMARALSTARDSGLSPWSALGRLGEELAVPELVELSSALELAGTEGTRIRQSLSARAVAMRRREQADAESAANAMTERLFLPGALLLMGFLLFIGYPAFTRILGGT